jgi:hypothetical protein
MKRLFISSFIVVVVSVLLIKFVLTPVLNTMVQTSMATSIEQYNQDLAKGVYYLVQQELQKMPQSNWKIHIEKMQRHFGYPLSFRDYHEVSFTEHQRSQLLSGKIVVIDYGKMFWQRIGSSSYIIGMGPLVELRPSIPVTIMAWIAITAIVGRNYLSKEGATYSVVGAC